MYIALTLHAAHGVSIQKVELKSRGEGAFFKIFKSSRGLTSGLYACAVWKRWERPRVCVGRV